MMSSALFSALFSAIWAADAILLFIVVKRRDAEIAALIEDAANFTANEIIERDAEISRLKARVAELEGAKG